MYLTETITREEINKWKVGDSIFIDAPTGSGKSHLIKYNINEHCIENNLKALLISNRRLLKQQNNNELNEIKNNRIKTINYQALENKSEIWSLIKTYDIIVMDEVHYLLSDSSFNRGTDTLFPLLENPPKDKIVIYLTATPSAIYNHKSDYTYKYELPRDYSYIKELYFYSKDEVLQQILYDIPYEEKGLYFCCSADNSYVKSLSLPNSAFICSENHKYLAKHSSKKERNNIVEKEKFDCQVLCTTKVLDNGVNIKDEKLKHIIIDMLDPIDFIQCLGRKRVLSESDGVVLYVKDYHAGRLSTYSRKLSVELKMANELLNSNIEEFAQRYKKTALPPVIFTDLTVNMARYRYIKYLQNLYYSLSQEKDMYKKMICEILGFNYDNIQIAENRFEKKNLSELIETWMGIDLFKEEQERFKTMFFNNMFTTKGVNYRNRGMNCINTIMDEDELPYTIRSKQCKSGKNRGKTFWRILKIEDRNL